MAVACSRARDNTSGSVSGALCAAIVAALEHMTAHAAMTFQAFRITIPLPAWAGQLETN
jgi:hypothetical protein